MKLKQRTVFFTALFILLSFIPGLSISTGPDINLNCYAENSAVSKEAIDILSKTNRAMAEVTAAVKPAVVNISSTKTIKGRGNDPFLNDPFFKRFFGDEFSPFERPRRNKQSGLGSGVIVDKDGYILTNNHVIRDADEIMVKLSDKREFRGKIIGADQKTDLAVIKIDSNHLPVIRLGDSDSLKVGETVIAVGNPFGLNQTVTSGIVSATGRANVGIADYEDFIQTDAPINPGNSGGALVNIRGELVGINTAIFSTSGGYQGIGFAIPSNMAKVVMDSLVRKGKVTRGWIGVSMQPVTRDLVKQFALKDDKGALVGDVAEGGPAEKAGIQRGDVIVEYEGKEVNDASGLRNMVAVTPPGKEISLKIFRDGKSRSLKLSVSELPSEIKKQSATFDNNLKGVHIQNITPELRSSLGIPKRTTGVAIAVIEEGSAAEGLLAQNDVILEVNRKKITNVKEYDSVVSKIKPGQDIVLLIFRNGLSVYVTLTNR